MARKDHSYKSDTPVTDSSGQIDTNAVVGLIDHAVAELESALASAQMVPAAQAEAAIDGLEARLQDSITKLKEASETIKKAAPPADTMPADEAAEVA